MNTPTRAEQIEAAAMEIVRAADSDGGRELITHVDALLWLDRLSGKLGALAAALNLPPDPPAIAQEGHSPASWWCKCGALAYLTPACKRCGCVAE